MEATTVTREQLYDLVWQQPASKLAAQWGISAAVLVQGCRMLNVPRPPRGYWARRAAGHRVQRPPLPPAGGAPLTMSFAGRPRPDKPPEADHGGQPSKPSDVPVSPRLSALRQPAPLVRQCQQQLRLQNPDARGMRRATPVEGLSVRMSPEMERRALVLLDTLLKRLARAHMPVEAAAPRDLGPGRPCLMVAGEPVCLSLHEHYVQRMKTDGERRAEQAAGAFWVSKVHCQPTGRMSVLIDVPVARQQARWSDGTASLEEQLEEIVRFLQAMPAQVQACLRQHQEMQRQRDIEQEAQRQAQRLREQQTAYLAELRAEAQAYREFCLLCSYLDQVEAVLIKQLGELPRDARHALAEARTLAAKLDKRGERATQMQFGATLPGK